MDGRLVTHPRNLPADSSFHVLTTGSNAVDWEDNNPGNSVTT